MSQINWLQRAQQASFSLRHCINGKLINLADKEGINKYSTRDGSFLYTVADASPAEVEQAVVSARSACKDQRWSGLPLHQRQSVLHKLADLIDANQETLALYECLDAGKPISQAMGEISQSSGLLRETVDSASHLFSSYASDGTYSAYQLRKPVGVVAAITAWNFPLMLSLVKLAPALVMGNSLILKPSEHAALSTGYLAELALEAGVPAGVLNVLHGAGHSVGSGLALHNDVDLLSFTGSSATGKRMHLAAGESNMKRLLLECGGKSPFIVFDDCPTDLDILAGDIAGQAFFNQSQNCMAASRLLVHRDIKDALLPKIVEQAQQRVPQDILLPDTSFGAMIHEAHLEKVLSYVDCAQREGASRLCGGERVMVDTDTATQGFYIQPAVFDGVKPNDTLAQEEIFGPVLSVISFDTEQEAIDIANNSDFGLAAYMATEDIKRAQRVSQQVNAGYIQVVASSNPAECVRELGKEGHRQSGYGYENGLEGLMSYSLATAVHQWA